MPDPLVASGMAPSSKQGGGPTVIFDDPSLKMSIMKGDTTKFDELMPDRKEIEDLKRLEEEFDTKNKRSVVLNKPPKPTSINIIAPSNPKKSSNQLTPKGSPKNNNNNLSGSFDLSSKNNVRENSQKSSKDHSMLMGGGSGAPPRGNKPRQG